MSTTTEAKEERIRRRRSDILRAAVELFQEQGFHSTTTHQVADRAGISVGLIYQYFGNKEDLLRAAIVDILADFRDRIPAAMDAAGSDPEARLRNGFGALVAVIDEKPEATVLSYRESMTLSKEGRDEIKKLEIETAEPFRAALADGVATGAFGDVDVDLVVHNLLLTAHGWALKQWRLASWLDREAYVEAELDLLLRAITT
ncbi:MAG TPA: TetR/AcrR family transcriptional regulator [Intrasporangium sp.]|uniref:TetR/AcrR family transcriptional regulator n=1 Tax=Intrasporangium sp. TaxID=1925024 RepID=UPI002B4A9AC4|nr:TetR/AcrR family transcriptional regulator [Intrasporangium sp.]HKX67418.1 TetR/AcrR family transcriptional regulator [Intrasporangium sp.]